MTKTKTCLMTTEESLTNFLFEHVETDGFDLSENEEGTAFGISVLADCFDSEESLNAFVDFLECHCKFFSEPTPDCAYYCLAGGDVCIEY